jgi:hypothetical protein
MLKLQEQNMTCEDDDTDIVIEIDEDIMDRLKCEE